MPPLVVLSEADTRRLLSLEELAGAVEQSLVALSRGETSVPPRTAAVAPSGLLGVMPGYVKGMGLAAKLVSVYPSNAEHGMASHQALIAVFDDSTGTPVALIGGTFITAVRTAVTVVVAASRLARPGPASLGIIGAGVQGEAHLESFATLLAPGSVRIASREKSRAEALAARHPNAAAVSFEEAVSESDIVCCCTDASEPVLENEWVGPGTHLSSVGSGEELPAELLARSRIFVESRTTVTSPRPAGAVELQGRDPKSLVEIGEVLAGLAEGRTSDQEVTVFKSTGLAVEDVAAAHVVLRRARATGAGTMVEMS